jgi:hypothetical protein
MNAINIPKFKINCIAVDCHHKIGNKAVFAKDGILTAELLNMHVLWDFGK